MEHEVLFRGKDMFTGQWVEGYYFETGYGREECHYIFSGKVDTQSRYDPIYEKAQVDPSTVGQYTGMTDKNGKRIFEGDLLKYLGDPDDNTPYRVHWRGMGWFTQYENCMPDSLDTSRPDDWEVVGDIWDNPELVEVKK